MIRHLSLLLVLTLALPALGAPPRYKLRPGQHLLYRGSEITVSNARFGLERSSEIRVVRINADTSRTVVLSQHHQRTDARQDPPQIVSERDDLYIIDVFPDGRIAQRSNDTLGVMSRLLPQLPADNAALDKVWSFKASDFTYVCYPLSDDASSFRLEPNSGRDEINGFTSRATYTIDTDAGYVQSITSTFFHKLKLTRKGTEALNSVQSIPAPELAMLAGDVDVFVEAKQAYDETMGRATSSTAGDESRRLLDVAMIHLQTARARMMSNLLKAQVETMIHQHNMQMPRTLDRIEQLTNIIGHPNENWTHEDIDGAMHSIEDHRGEVLVLDFWYRACGWCIRAMPQMNALATRFEGRPVAILGMNIDRKLEDAIAVVNRMQLNYPTLRSHKDIARGYGVSAFPTLVVVDTKGVVRMVHTGFSTTLEEDLSAFIEALLAEAN